MKHSILPKIRLFLLAATLTFALFLPFSKINSQKPISLKINVAPTLHVFWNNKSFQPSFLTNNPEQKFEILKEKNNDQEVTFSVVANL